MMFRCPTGVTYSDGILLFYLLSLAHSCIDILYHSAEFEQCQKPIHVWLLVSYVSLIGLRVPHYVSQFSAGHDGVEDASVAWKGFSKICLMVVWFALLPFFTVWTVLGSFWLNEVLEETPSCLQSSTDPKFVIFWQVICYTWILIYSVCIAIAMVIRHRQQRADAELRAIASLDSQERWGSMIGTWHLTPLLGMSAKDISALPACNLEESSGAECSICLCVFQEGETLRRLPTCGHCFHQGCIDLWLLRQNKCPLCKGDVVAPSIAV